MDCTRRQDSAALLPSPFRDWNHGDIFAAVVDLGALAQNANHDNSRDIWLPLANGDFSSLGDTALFQGWNLMRGWPTAIDALLRQIIDSRRACGKLQHVLGPIGRFCHSQSKTPLHPLMEERVGVILRELNIPSKVFSCSGALRTERTNSIAMWEAEQELGISAKSLRRLAAAGDCLLEKSPGSTGLHLFGRTRLETTVSLTRSGVNFFKFSKEMGIPAYVVATFVEHKLVEQILDPNVQILSHQPLLAPESVASLFDEFEKLSPPRTRHNMTSLSKELAQDLSPFAWSTALTAVKSGELPAFLTADGRQWCERLVVDSGVVRDHLAAARAIPLPDMHIPARTAAPKVGVNDVVLGQAVIAGLLRRHEEDFLLKEFLAFRTKYIFPSEISKWFNDSGLRFARAMAEAGMRPVATLNKINIWQRSDVVRIFRESALAEYEAN